MFSPHTSNSPSQPSTVQEPQQPPSLYNLDGLQSVGLASAASSHSLWMTACLTCWSRAAKKLLITTSTSSQHRLNVGGVVITLIFLDVCSKHSLWISIHLKRQRQKNMLFTLYRHNFWQSNTDPNLIGTQELLSPANARSIQTFI